MSSTNQFDSFRNQVLAHYRQAGRHDLPWRQPGADGGFDPYAIMVSELMLQQTQVSRVIPKYLAFLERFSDVEALAAAPLSAVLVAWQGLGYNRRARYLWQAAQHVVGQAAGRFPVDIPGLTVMPGVGSNTAGAIMAYAYDAPVLFVETNVRTVYLHHFFREQTGVTDKQLLPLLQATLPPSGSSVGSNRRWYWALMDYGAHLKRAVGNASRGSTAYNKQSAFQGSRRQVRGVVLRALASGPLEMRQLTRMIVDDRLAGVLDDLGREQLISRQEGRVALYE